MAAGWTLGASGASCTATCAAVPGHTCDPEANYARLGEVDEQQELVALLTALGETTTCSNSDISAYPNAKDVPCMHDNGNCYATSGSRPTKGISCDHSKSARKRLCYCSFMSTPPPPPTYVLVDSEMTWTDAEAYCVNTYGGHLARIASSAQNTLARDARGSHTVWIGFNDRAQEGAWTWSDGSFQSADSYTRWDSGEPNDDGSGGEDCATLIGSPPGWQQTTGKWNDRSCTSEQRFLCQTLPWKTTVTLIASGTVEDYTLAAREQIKTNFALLIGVVTVGVPLPTSSVTVDVTPGSVNVEVGIEAGDENTAWNILHPG